MEGEDESCCAEKLIFDSLKLFFQRGKMMKNLKVTEEFEIPNSNVFVEKGDVIRIEPKKKESITVDNTAFLQWVQRSKNKEMVSAIAALLEANHSTMDVGDFLYDLGFCVGCGLSLLDAPLIMIKKLKFQQGLTTGYQADNSY